ncbi:uncharacterized protein B0T15DRAFT_526025 [Chaetomium strumarium]|uniref:Uncharacterized protein n=1 Tax=Chaetomium strumarium TaxID=1170767 RepID=A0AAJ0M511_9PEZI|nr:hypothetical protein B0T15DRAFT_526025 [Chaetomium strumarium]
MHPYRGRSGPSKTTPTNVQCQKCLKRDMCSFTRGTCSSLTIAERHYSYECKATPQERPYAARPSRTQQLFNPKLLPKLSSETPNVLQEKKGIADEELAKREAERARKRQREADEEAASSDSPPPRRNRSPSYDSVSSISTTRSPSPAPRRSASPPRRERRRHSRSPSPRGSHGRRYSRDLSTSPDRGYQGRSSHPLRSASPRRSPSPPRRYERSSHGPRRHDSPEADVRVRDSSVRRARSRSRSPVRREDREDRRGEGRYRDRDEHGYGSPPPPPRQPSPPRERSLSPFSKRLALTQAMNRGGR